MIQPRPTAQQSRSKLTERKFLRAFDELLRLHGFSQTTVDDVAELSGQTRSSFLKRFGSKQGALEVLFEKYCDDASATAGLFCGRRTTMISDNHPIKLIFDNPTGCCRE